MENPWRGFAIQRNVAIDAAHGDWILEVDADERVSPELRTSIEALLEHPPEGVDMAVCALRNRFLGGLLGPSAKYSRLPLAAVPARRLRHDESLTVHEGLELRELPAILDRRPQARAGGEDPRGAVRHLELCPAGEPPDRASSLRGGLSEGNRTAPCGEALLSHDRGRRLARRVARAAEGLARRGLRRAGVDLRPVTPRQRARTLAVAMSARTSGRAEPARRGCSRSPTAAVPHRALCAG